MHSVKKIVVVGSTSDTGRVIANNVKAAGHQLVEVSRAAGISMDNQQDLVTAFKGADAAYLMVPFDMIAPDLHSREELLCANLKRAVELSNVKRIVVLSGANAYLKSDTSIGAAIL